MNRRMLLALGGSLLTCAWAPSIAAAADSRRDFSVEISVVGPGAISISLGSASGQATLAGDGSLQLPALALAAPGAANFTAPGSPSGAAVSLVPSAFGGGRLSKPNESGGFGGAVGIRGVVLLELLGETVAELPELEVPLVVGSLASSVGSAFTTSPATGAPPAQVMLSLSQSRWTTEAVSLAGTRDRAVTSQSQVTGSRLTTALGGQQISLVSPLYIHVASVDDTGVARSRTIALGSRMQISLPAPGVLASQLTAVVVLVMYGRAKHQPHIRRVDGRSTDPNEHVILAELRKIGLDE